MALAATWMDLEIIVLSEVKKVEDKWRSNKKILKTSAIILSIVVLLIDLILYIKFKEYSMYKPDVSFKILSKPWDKPELLTKFTQNPILKSSIKPNPVLEEMLDEAILKRSIPLHSTEFTMNVIKSKYPNLSDDVKECLEILKTYYNKV